VRVGGPLAVSVPSCRQPRGHGRFLCRQTRDRDAKRFLQTALANPDNRPPRLFSVDGNRSYLAAIRQLHMVILSRRVATDTRGTEISHGMAAGQTLLASMQRARTIATARTVIEGYFPDPRSVALNAGDNKLHESLLNRYPLPSGKTST
jgi:hypothetical protein